MQWLFSFAHKFEISAHVDYCLTPALRFYIRSAYIRESMINIDNMKLPKAILNFQPLRRTYGWFQIMADNRHNCISKTMINSIKSPTEIRDLRSWQGELVGSTYRVRKQWLYLCWWRCLTGRGSVQDGTAAAAASHQGPCVHRTGSQAPVSATTFVPTIHDHIELQLWQIISAAVIQRLCV